MTQTPITRDKVRLRRSPVFTKRPTVFDIDNGELAVNYNAYEPGMFVRVLDDAGEYEIRKIGPVHLGSVPPNSTAGDYDFPEGYAHAEMWVDTTDGEDEYVLKIWNKNANAGAGDWIVVGEVYGRVDGYLDQFKDGADGDDYIHTDRTRLKINNKTALRGLSTASGNRLIINEGGEFATGVTVDSGLMTPFQTDSVTSNVFTYTAHGLFNGERVFVRPFLANQTTPSPVPAGDYVVINATNNTFQISEDGVTPEVAGSNIFLSQYEEVVIDANSNIYSSGNFAYKDLNLAPDNGQIEDGHWDVYYNSSNGNVRIFARAGNTLIEPEGPGLSIEVKNSSTSQTLQAGTPVYITGYDPVTKIAKVAKSDTSDPDTMPSIGVLKNTLGPSGRGYVIFLGRIENLDTDGLPGSLGGGTADEGRVLYVAEGGGLSLSSPTGTVGRAQAIAILVKQSPTAGVIVVNNPATFTGLPPIPENYVWVGDSDDLAAARRLDSDSFQVRLADDSVVELALASNIKFGGYEFLYDGNANTKIQVKASSDEIDSADFSRVTIETFNSASYRSAKYLVQVTGLGASPEYEISEILIVHNGTTAHLTQYGTTTTRNDGERLGDFDAELIGGEVRLIFQRRAAAQNNISVRVLRTAILV
jgi:hypothetical protein